MEFLLNRPSINLRIRNNDKKTAKEESLINPEIFHLFENYFQTSKTHPKITNKIVIHNANPVAISNLLGKHYQRFNAKIQENFFDNVSNIQTTATYSSNSNTINDFSFLGGVTDDESYQDNENLKEKITLDSFNIKGLIGKGSFGEVFLVEKKNSNIMYAMKVLKKSLIMSNKF